MSKQRKTHHHLGEFSKHRKQVAVAEVEQNDEAEEISVNQK